MRFAFVDDTWLPSGARTSSDFRRVSAAEFEYKPARKKRILVLSVSAGAGHIRAAEAIRAYACASGAGVTAMHLDVMDHVPAGFRKIYTDFYITLISKYPALWGHLYQLANEAKPDGLIQKFRQLIQRLSATRLVKEIASFEPDAIVCTHFLPAEILAHRIRNAGLSCPVWVQVTDFELHRMWVHESMAGYFAANDEVAFLMRSQGIAPEKIHTTGIPILPAFAARLDRAECARELGLDPQRMIFLLMGGGAGLGRLDEVAARLLDLDAHFQLIVMAGKNADALAALQVLAARYPNRLIAQGYTNQVERLMACADLAITKPGGLTTSECLAMGLPMIVNSPIRGQEERNADFLLEQGVALKACDAGTLEYRIRYLLEHPARLGEMRARAKALGRPLAARSVTDIVLERL
jgi:processive 1,2-diacylglycerol beta-glucosyltransferase